MNTTTALFFDKTGQKDSVKCHSEFMEFVRRINLWDEMKRESTSGFALSGGEEFLLEE